MKSSMFIWAMLAVVLSSCVTPPATKANLFLDLKVTSQFNFFQHELYLNQDGLCLLRKRVDETMAGEKLVRFKNALNRESSLNRNLERETGHDSAMRQLMEHRIHSQLLLRLNRKQLEVIIGILMEPQFFEYTQHDHDDARELEGSRILDGDQFVLIGCVDDKFNRLEFIAGRYTPLQRILQVIFQEGILGEWSVDEKLVAESFHKMLSGKLEGLQDENMYSSKDANDHLNNKACDFPDGKSCSGHQIVHVGTSSCGL